MLVAAVSLCVGKLLGVGTTTVVVTRTRFAAMPAGASLADVWGAAALAGIGFTVSLFVTGLAFGSSPIGDAARVGVFGGSVVAALVGTAIFRRSRGRTRPS